jgi:hypothetical protein
MYTACDNADEPIGTWLWEGQEWQDLRPAEIAETLTKWRSYKQPKPEPKPEPEPEPVVIDRKVYRSAEDFSADYAAKTSGPPSPPVQGVKKPKVEKVKK